MQKGKPFIQATAQEAARPAVVQTFGVFLGYSVSGYGAMVPAWWGGILHREDQRQEEVAAAPSPIRCCRGGSCEHPVKLQTFQLVWVLPVVMSSGLHQRDLWRSPATSSP